MKKEMRKERRKERRKEKKERKKERRRERRRGRRRGRRDCLTLQAGIGIFNRSSYTHLRGFVIFTHLHGMRICLKVKYAYFVQ